MQAVSHAPKGLALPQVRQYAPFEVYALWTQ